MTAHKVALNAFVYGNDKDEEILGMSGSTKNKDIFPHSNAANLISNHIFIDEDNSDLHVEWHAYKTTLIASSHN